MGKITLCTLAIATLSVAALGQGVNYLLTTGLGSWGTDAGDGLVGMGIEVAQQGVGVEAFLGIGANRVQGWALRPRIYLAGEEWWPFGELPLMQVTETQIEMDPARGLIKTVYTWQFMGVGVGVVYARGDRSLRVSLGLGVNGGQCLRCGAQGYASIHIGWSFQTRLDFLGN